MVSEVVLRVVRVGQAFGGPQSRGVLNASEEMVGRMPVVSEGPGPGGGDWAKLKIPKLASGIIGKVCSCEMFSR